MWWRWRVEPQGARRSGGDPLGPAQPQKARGGVDLGHRAGGELGGDAPQGHHRPALLRGICRGGAGPGRTSEVAVLLCRVGALRVWASVEDVVLVFGAPRKGKTGWFVGRVLDAPGAVIATSTKTDLYDVTHRLRAAAGPVSVFAPTGHADLASTITFDPLTGCASPTTAARAGHRPHRRRLHRAGDQQRGSERWEGQARRVLTALLHAAALGGCSMHTVLRWVANPDTAVAASDEPAAPVTQRRGLRPGRRAVPDHQRPDPVVDHLDDHALLWGGCPTRRRAPPPPATAPFDVAELLRAKATVYLLGAKETQRRPAALSADRAHRPGSHPDRRPLALRAAGSAADPGPG